MWSFLEKKAWIISMMTGMTLRLVLKDYLKEYKSNILPLIEKYDKKSLLNGKIWHISLDIHFLIENEDQVFLLSYSKKKRYEIRNEKAFLEEEFERTD